MGWEQLQAMLADNRAQAARKQREPPVACPIDGEPLDIHPDGRRACPLGNYSWPPGAG